MRRTSGKLVGADAHIGPVPAYLHTKRADVLNRPLHTETNIQFDWKNLHSHFHSTQIL